VLAVPDGVDVRKVDLAVELQILAFHEQRKASSSANGNGDGPARLGAAAAPTTTVVGS
jgi:redox-sensing transcriptional repressor